MIIVRLKTGNWSRLPYPIMHHFNFRSSMLAKSPVFPRDRVATAAVRRGAAAPPAGEGHRTVAPGYEAVLLWGVVGGDVFGQPFRVDRVVWPLRWARRGEERALEFHARSIDIRSGGGILLGIFLADLIYRHFVVVLWRCIVGRVGSMAGSQLTWNGDGNEDVERQLDPCRNVVEQLHLKLSNTEWFHHQQVEMLILFMHPLYTCYLGSNCEK